MRSESEKAIGIAIGVVVFIWSINGVYLSALSNFSKSLFWVADITQWVVIPSIILWVLASQYQVKAREYGLVVNGEFAKFIVFGFVAAITFYPEFFGVRNMAWSMLGYTSANFSYANVYPGGWLGSITWVYSAVSAGVIESIFFISLPWLLWSTVVKKRVVLFVCISSVVFAAVHWELGIHIVAGAFVFNLAACSWYFQSRSLWPVVIGHTIIDLIAFG
jgi:hypothetical protein